MNPRPLGGQGPSRWGRPSGAPRLLGWEGRAALVLAVAYLLTRLWGLAGVPLYYDEPIILHWGLVVGRERFVSVAGLPPALISVWGGKEPLLAWFTGLSQGLLAIDPVVAGRLPALLGGAAALATLVVVGRWLFSPSVAYLGGLFYLLWPYALLFNVQLQPDSLLAGEAALMLLGALAIVRGPPQASWLSVVGLALAFAAALLTKSSALLYALALPALLLARPGASAAGLQRPVVRLVIALLAGYLVYYAVFGRTPYARDVADYNSIFVLTIAELLFLPFDQWLANARFLAGNALDLLGILPALLVVASLVWAWRRGGAALGLAIWIAVPAGLHLLVGTGLFARYFAPVLPWVALLSAAALAAGVDGLRARWGSPVSGLRSQVPGLRGSGRRSGVGQVGGVDAGAETGGAGRGGLPVGQASVPALGSRQGPDRRLCLAGIVSGLALLLVQPAFVSFRLLADAPWTIARGYTHDFGAVLAELREELGRQAALGPVVLLIYRGQGPLEDGAWVFLGKEPGVRLLYLAPQVEGHLMSGPGVPPSADLVPYDPGTGAGVPARDLRGARVYFVGGDGRTPPPGTVGHVEPVVTFTGLAGTHPLTLFRPTWDAAYWDGEGLFLR